MPHTVRPPSRPPLLLEGFEKTARETSVLNGTPQKMHGPLTVDGKFFRLGGERIHLRGVTYGPFALNANGDPFPNIDRVRSDLEQMSQLGVNAIRTYHLPPISFLEQVAASGHQGILIDIPWAKHLCFLDSEQARHDARNAVQAAVTRGSQYDCVWAYSIANEIPPDIVRWHGSRRIERFLRELADVAKQADSRALVTYANYPPTEYLDLTGLDFATFNVYLHDRETFRRYLFRLQNLVGEQPLVLGELGMDSLRQGAAAQAQFLAGHVQEAAAVGAAGAFVFSWTDEWHTGGAAIENWAFGITDRNREPKLAFHALKKTFAQSPLDYLVATVPASVVVCTYNGGRTIEQCLKSLEKLNYPDYEVIVVDDGSTDNTPEILTRFPNVRVVRQENLGLSVARNTGLQAATGAVVAYTDDDCFADPDWLTMMIAQLERARLEDCMVAGVGGPNLTPDDGPIAAAVAAAPGQPMHILESDQVAEHIPGCNMAFWREALEMINGFEPQYRAAGDDVDICWRLQAAGYWLTFAPSAFVWHHRRSTPKAYLKQQAGYGKAEALLRFQHPDRFTDRGHGKWRGMLYGAGLRGLVIEEPIIYRGTFCTAPFQCIYRPGPAHWAMIPSTLEWHVLAGLTAAAACAWGPLVFVALAMWCTSLLIAGLQAAQAKIARKHDSLSARLTISALCYLQPLVRSWARYRTRYFTGRITAVPLRTADIVSSAPAVATSPRDFAYWGPNSPERTDLLRAVTKQLGELRWGQSIDTGWSDGDLEVFADPWTHISVRTVQEEHGGGKRLIRVRLEPGLSRFAKLVFFANGCAAVWGASTIPWVSAILLGIMATLGVILLRRGRKLRALLTTIFHEQSRQFNLMICGNEAREVVESQSTKES